MDVSDWTDQASDQEQLDRDLALGKIVRYAGESAQDCMDCGLAIPSARQLAVPGCQYCTECADRLERTR